MPRPDRLFLFDIDGTLLSAGSHAVAAYQEAFCRILGEPLDIREVECAGRTDPHIVRSLLALHGHPQPDAGLLTALFNAFVGELERLVNAGATFTPLPGAKPVLAALSRRSHARLGLLTGNLEAGAHVKLRGAGLSGYFRTGAYGSDHEDRNRLGRIAIRRATALFGTEFPPEAVYIIGDSVHDVRCARAAGVQAVAVASGTTSRKELAAEEPDHLLERLDMDFFSTLLC